MLPQNKYLIFQAEKINLRRKSNDRGLTTRVLSLRELFRPLRGLHHGFD
jgi:hypothetical protein